MQYRHKIGKKVIHLNLLLLCTPNDGDNMNMQKLLSKSIITGGITAAMLSLTFIYLSGAAHASRASRDVRGVLPNPTIRLLVEHRAQMAAARRAATNPQALQTNPTK